MKYLKSFNESIRDLMVPKSEEEIKEVWDKYWGMKTILHNKYPANAYSVTQHGGIHIDWGEVGKSLGFDNLPKIQRDIIKLMDDNGFVMTNYVPVGYHQPSSIGKFKLKT